GVQGVGDAAQAPQRVDPVLVLGLDVGAVGEGVALLLDVAGRDAGVLADGDRPGVAYAGVVVGADEQGGLGLFGGGGAGSGRLSLSGRRGGAAELGDGLLGGLVAGHDDVGGEGVEG